MTASSHALEAPFLALQRARLLALRGDLQRSIEDDAVEAVQAESADRDNANEIEDRAQVVAIGDNDRALSRQLGQQRIAIDRALAKIDEGTYGFSDASGVPIPLSRLRAFPQAT